MLHSAFGSLVAWLGAGLVSADNAVNAVATSTAPARNQPRPNGSDLFDPGSTISVTVPDDGSPVGGRRVVRLRQRAGLPPRHRHAPRVDQRRKTLPGWSFQIPRTGCA